MGNRSKSPGVERRVHFQSPRRRNNYNNNNKDNSKYNGFLYLRGVVRSKTVNFLIDTGAKYSVITYALAKRLGMTKWINN